MKIHAIFGSDSDDKKIRPGLLRAKQEIPNIEIVVHFASGDNTPEKVDRIMKDLDLEGRVPIISGAGMSNVLTGFVKRYCGLNNLVIGVPITDPYWGGLSAVLSTGEKPPLNPVAAVGLDNTYAAVNIAARFIEGNYERVVIYGNRGRGVVSSKDMLVDESAIDSVKAEVDKLGIPNEVVGLAGIGKDDLVITIFNHYNVLSHDEMNGSETLRSVDQMLREGRGIQVGVRQAEEVMRPDLYLKSINDLDTTCIVSVGWYGNAAQIAAQIMGHQAALDIIKGKKVVKAEKLGDNPGYTV